MYWRLLLNSLLVILLSISFLTAAGNIQDWVSWNTDGLTASIEYPISSSWTWEANESSGWYRQFQYFPSNLTLKFNHTLFPSPMNASFDLTSGIISLYHNFINSSQYVVIYYKFERRDNYSTYTLIARNIYYSDTQILIEEDVIGSVYINSTEAMQANYQFQHDLFLNMYTYIVYNTTNDPSDIQLKLQFQDTVTIGNKNYSFSSDFVVSTRALPPGDNATLQKEINDFVYDHYGWWAWLGVGYIFTSPISYYQRSYVTSVEINYFSEKIQIIGLFDKDSPVTLSKVRYHNVDQINIMPLVPVGVGIGTGVTFRKELDEEYSAIVAMIVAGGIAIILGFFNMFILFILGVIGVFLWR